MSVTFSIDRQNKDLKVKLSELEMLMKTRSKAAMQALEAKIANLEEQLEVESRYYFTLSRAPSFYVMHPSFYTLLIILLSHSSCSIQYHVFQFLCHVP